MIHTPSISDEWGMDGLLFIKQNCYTSVFISQRGGVSLLKGLNPRLAPLRSQTFFIAVASVKPNAGVAQKWMTRFYCYVLN